MNPLLHRVARGKRVRLDEYCTRVIAHNCQSDVPGSREDMIGEVLQYHRDCITDYVEQKERETAASASRHLEARLAAALADLDKYKSAYLSMKANAPTSIPLREAEEGCLKSFNLAREKAAMLFEGEGGQPTESSEAIRAIPDPKPRWSKR